jgi:hypothetical protein
MGGIIRSTADCSTDGQRWPAPRWTGLAAVQQRVPPQPRAAHSGDALPEPRAARGDRGLADNAGAPPSQPYRAAGDANGGAPNPRGSFIGLLQRAVFV